MRASSEGYQESEDARVVLSACRVGTEAGGEGEGRRGGGAGRGDGGWGWGRGKFVRGNGEIGGEGQVGGRWGWKEDVK